MPAEGENPFLFYLPYRHPEGCVAYTLLDLNNLPSIIQPSRGWRLNRISIEHAAYYKMFEDVYMLWAQDNWLRDPTINYRR